MLGYAKIRNKQDYTRWLRSISGERRETKNGVTGNWYYDHWKDYFYTRQAEFNGVENIFTDRYTDSKDRFIALIETLEEEGERLCYYRLDSVCCVVGYGTARYLMPPEWFDFQPLKDYSSLTAAGLAELGGRSGNGAGIEKAGNAITLQASEESLSGTESAHPERDGGP